MINFIIWIVVGGIIGWLASLVMRTDMQQGLLLNIDMGIVGAFLGGWSSSPLFGIASMSRGKFSIPALFIAFLGAVIFLAVMNFIRRGHLH